MATGKVSDVVTKDEILRHCFGILAVRRQSFENTDLRRLKYEVQDKMGVKYTNDEFYKSWKKLQSLGLGALILPKKVNYPARFKWNKNSTPIVRELVEAKAIRPLAPTVEAPMTEPVGKSKSLTISYPLRDGVVTLQAPSDVTKEEMAALGRFISQFGRS